MHSQNNPFISSRQELASSSRLRGHRRSATNVTQARAKAQRTKIDQEAQQRRPHDAVSEDEKQEACTVSKTYDK